MNLLLTLNTPTGKGHTVQSKQLNFNLIKDDEYFTVGQKIKVKWTREEIGDSGWRAGWYSAQVQEVEIEEDNIRIVYFTEPNCIYTVCVSEYLANRKLKVA